MKRKDKKTTTAELDNRLSSDEAAWLKQLSCLGDVARYCRTMEAQLKKDRRVILRLHKRIIALDLRVKTLEGSKPNDVAQG
jgi:hypothetical protein